MRQLRVVGLGDDTSTVILEDPVRHERFTVASDERLRAAARGDVRRLGQMEIEISSPLRPRDIQSRVRGGEAVEDVAATAGVSISHVERFAYPVLLERARVAELASRAHPLRDDRPDPRALGEIVSATLAARGQDYDDARWDAWKGEDGRWTVALSWTAGHSDHAAHWAFRPGASGGVVEARDDAAREVGGESPSGPRRADGRAGRPARPEAEVGHEPDPDLELDTPMVVNGPTLPAPPPPAAPGPSAGATPPASPPIPPPAPSSRTAAVRASRRVPDQRGAVRRPVPSPSTPAPSAPAPAAPAPAEGDADDGERARPGRKRHPIVPSWEDVLLGVRSPKD